MKQKQMWHLLPLLAVSFVGKANWSVTVQDPPAADAASKAMIAFIPYQGNRTKAKAVARQKNWRLD